MYTSDQRATCTPPHLLVFNSVLLTLLNDAKTRLKEDVGDTLSKDLIEDIQEYMKNYQDSAKEKIDSPDDTAAIQSAVFDLMATDVKYVRVTQCWDSSMTKLEVLALPSSPSHRLVLSLFEYMQKHMKAKLKPNVAPRGALERQISTWLNTQE